MAISNGSNWTVTGLKRWSCADKQLPEVAKVKAIHIYDFDNTLFSSPLPNRQIWDGATIGKLQALEWFIPGGWWHDVNILKSTGKGIEIEEPRGWEGWWNENIVELVRLSMQQEDAVSILLTGRKESAFAELIQRMARSKQLDFDMVCLKPEVGPDNQKLTSTMMYKQELLQDLVNTYRDAEELKIYEDRPKHTQGFRDFFNTMNRSLQLGQVPNARQPFTAEVVQVTEQTKYLDPVTEVAEIQRMINSHNTSILSGEASPSFSPLRINRNVFFTAYLVSPPDTDRLTKLLPFPKDDSPNLRILANSIPISFRTCSQQILNKVGGMGASVPFRVTHTGNWNKQIYAARVTPANPGQVVHTESLPHSMVLALSSDMRPSDVRQISNWRSVSPEAAVTFDTTVGEKVILRIEPEVDVATTNGQNGYNNNRYSSKHYSNDRKRDREEDFPALPTSRSNDYGSRNQTSHRSGYGRNNGGSGGGGGGGGGRDRNRDGRNGGGRNNRGGRGGGRGGGGGGGGRRRGGPGQYRSLDDAGGYGAGGGGGEGMQY